MDAIGRRRDVPGRQTLAPPARAGSVEPEPQRDGPLAFDPVYGIDELRAPGERAVADLPRRWRSRRRE
jgi:hypothetical protein